MRCAASLLLLLWLPSLASGGDLWAHHISLSPPAIATSYAASDSRVTDRLAWTELDLPRPEPDPRGPYATPLERPTPGPSFAEATRYDAVAVIVAGLRKLQSKLFISVTAYSSDDPDRQWDGLGEEGDGGGTVDFGGGLVQGGLTVGVGTGAGNASFSEVVEGDGNYFDLNPFQDVSAQFDFLIRSDPTKDLGVSAFVLRIRAAYHGAFNGVGTPSDEASTDSELTVSIGVVW